jgi:hypothetical protein
MPRTATVDDPGTCIDLTRHGPRPVTADPRLVAIALAEERTSRYPLRFYKTIPSSDDEVLYVFARTGITDLYLVYVANRGESRFLRRFEHGNLHIPCS